MRLKAARLKLRWQDADKFISAVHSQRRISGLSHDFYKYPARFSPEFCRGTINTFSNEGDLVADMFVGGGTTLVEARVSGRLGIGTDINSLANFVCRVKTRVYSRSDIQFVGDWFDQLPEHMNLRQKACDSDWWKKSGYFRNLECEQTWAIRRALELGVLHASQIHDRKREDFVRCVLLRAAQWALDGRKRLPSVAEFRARVCHTANRMVVGALEFSAAARRGDQLSVASGRRRTVCLHSPASGLASYISQKAWPAPLLVVTSPPYPGVHIVYHRWQVRGGRETPAPFWIANKLDGSGEAYYLMYARSSELKRYFKGIYSSFSALHSVSSPDTTIVQLVAFSDPASQLQRYLDAMDASGFREYLLSEHIDSEDGRLWRSVPNRKWHAHYKGRLASCNEVVLIHRPK